MMNDDLFDYSRRDAIRKLSAIAGGVTMVSVTGCSKILLSGGKVLFGDPKIESEFTKLTKVDLCKGDNTVLVVCSTPESVDADNSTLRMDLIDGVTHRMKLNGVKIINPNRVADWLESRDSSVPDLQQLARDFETDYIAWIEVQTFSLREPNSHNLLRGQTSGFIRVARIEDFSGQRRAMMAYTREFAMTYPEHQPVSETGRSAIVFHKEYVARLCDLLAERFYNHKAGKNF